MATPMSIEEMLNKHLKMFMTPCDEDGERSQSIHAFLSGVLHRSHGSQCIELTESPSPRDLLTTIRGFVFSKSIDRDPEVVLGLTAFEAWVTTRELAAV